MVSVLNHQHPTRLYTSGRHRVKSVLLLYCCFWSPAQSSLCLVRISITRPELSIAGESAVDSTVFSHSQDRGWLLRWEQVESLLALHALLLVGVVWGESGWVGRHGWVLISIVELGASRVRSFVGVGTYLKCVDALSLGVQVVPQIHRLCLIILINNKVKIVLLITDQAY